MTQKEKAKLVPVSREPALLTERDADKSPNASTSASRSAV